MASLTQIQKVLALRNIGWVPLSYIGGDPMKHRFGGPVIMMDPDTLQVFKVYASGRVVELVESDTPTEL